MSLMNEGGGIPAVMSVTPTGGSGNNGGGFGGWGGDWMAFIVLFLLFGLFGWGGFGGWGGGFGGNGGTAATQADIQRGFDTNSIISKLNGISQGICDSTFALNNAISGGFNATQMGMMQGFNAQNVAYLQGQSALQAQLADCCCTTQRAIDGVNYNMATNTCALQNTIQSTTRDIIDSQNAGTRAILDYLCQDKISALQAENQSLRMAASQANQNSVIGARIDAATAEILRKTGAECPMPAYVVQPPQPVTFPTNCCGQVNYAGNYGGCGNGCGC